MSKLDDSDEYNKWWDLSLFCSSLFSLICSFVFIFVLYHVRQYYWRVFVAQFGGKIPMLKSPKSGKSNVNSTNITNNNNQLQARTFSLNLNFEHFDDNIFLNDPTYVLHEILWRLSICDIGRSACLSFYYSRLTFQFWDSCDDPGNVDTIICVVFNTSEIIFFVCDILWYGVICLCFFRYLYYRQIFSNKISLKKIQSFVFLFSIISGFFVTTIGVITNDYDTDNAETVLPLLLILFSTLIFITVILLYIRLCVPFYVTSRDTRRNIVFLALFVVIYVLPMAYQLIIYDFYDIETQFSQISVFICDLVLTQTGSVNFFAWYFTSREFFAWSKITNLFTNNGNNERDDRYMSQSTRLTMLHSQNHFNNGDLLTRYSMLNSEKDFSNLSPNASLLNSSIQTSLKSGKALEMGYMPPHMNSTKLGNQHMSNLSNITDINEENEEDGYGNHDNDDNNGYSDLNIGPKLSRSMPLQSVKVQRNIKPNNKKKRFGNLQGLRKSIFARSKTNNQEKNKQSNNNNNKKNRNLGDGSNIVALNTLNQNQNKNKNKDKDGSGIRKSESKKAPTDLETAQAMFVKDDITPNGSRINERDDRLLSQSTLSTVSSQQLSGFSATQAYYSNSPYSHQSRSSSKKDSTHDMLYSYISKSSQSNNKKLKHFIPSKLKYQQALENAASLNQNDSDPDDSYAT